MGTVPLIPIEKKYIAQFCEHQFQASLKHRANGCSCLFIYLTVFGLAACWHQM
jgi:hypothetical protein